MAEFYVILIGYILNIYKCLDLLHISISLFLGGRNDDQGLKIAEPRYGGGLGKAGDFLSFAQVV